jgi:hypothetical protein
VISANSSYVLLGSTITSLLSRWVGRTGTCNSNIAKDGNSNQWLHTHQQWQNSETCSTNQIIVYYRPQSATPFLGKYCK